MLTESSTKPSSDFKRIDIACGGFIYYSFVFGVCVCGGAFFVVYDVVVIVRDVMMM